MSTEPLGDSSPPRLPLWLSEDRDALANSWEMFGPKSKRIVRIRGDLRYYCWLLLESDPTIIEICEEPVRIPVGTGVDRRTSLIEFWCRLCDGRELYLDTVYTSRLTKPDQRCQIEAAFQAKAAWVATQNASYAVATDKMVMQHPNRIANSSMLIRYVVSQSIAPHDDLSARIQRCVASSGRIKIHELSSIFHVDEDRLYAAVCRELHQGTIAADLESDPLGGKTDLWAAEAWSSRRTKGRS